MSDFSTDLYLRAERLCTMERMNLTLDQRMEQSPTKHIERLYQALRLEIANGATVEQAHENVRHTISKHLGAGREEF